MLAFQLTHSAHLLVELEFRQQHPASEAGGTSATAAAGGPAAADAALLGQDAFHGPRFDGSMDFTPPVHFA